MQERDVKQEARMKARQLAQEALQRGEATSWFDTLYSLAGGNEEAIPWADMVVNRQLASWFDTHDPEAAGKRALVVGCGLGDDAEYLASKDFDVLAFDISETAINWCRQRFPDSQVQYVAADLFETPASWNGVFDFVVEAYMVQALPHSVRAGAIQRIANFVAPRGSLLLICRGREESDPPGNMPWPLTRAEVDSFQLAGLRQVQFEDYPDPADPSVRRFRVLYQR